MNPKVNYSLQPSFEATHHIRNIKVQFLQRAFMINFKVKDYDNRKALEDAVISEFGRTVDKKDAKISGKVVELNRLRLQHNGFIWGVPVEASDYQPPVKSRVARGKKVAGKLNGVR